jgi:hypothetical protein
MAERIEQALVDASSVEVFALGEQRTLIDALERGSTKARSADLRRLEIGFHAAVHSQTYLNDYPQVDTGDLAKSPHHSARAWSNSGQAGTTTCGDRRRICTAKIAHAAAVSEPRRAAATVIDQIAPRRSPVRARLAPFLEEAAV